MYVIAFVHKELNRRVEGYFILEKLHKYSLLIANRGVSEQASAWFRTENYPGRVANISISNKEQRVFIL